MLLKINNNNKLVSGKCGKKVCINTKHQLEKLFDKATELNGYTDAKIFLDEELGIYKYVDCIRCYYNSNDIIAKATGNALFCLLNKKHVKEIWKEVKNKWDKIGYPYKN